VKQKESAPLDAGITHLIQSTLEASEPALRPLAAAQKLRVQVASIGREVAACTLYRQGTRSQSWFFDQHYYVGLADDMDLGLKYVTERGN